MDLNVVPKSHPLTGCIAKYQRAQFHYDTLRSEIEKRYGGDDALPTFTMERGLDPDNPRVFRWVVSSFDEPPLEWATIVGDVVHNLRSSLDHLVYELSFLGTRGKPGEKTAFPCALTKKSWNNNDTQQVKLQGVLERHKKKLYTAQPSYRRRDDASPGAFDLRRHNALWVLHELSNDDKHRMLLPVKTCITNLEFVVVGSTDCRLVSGAPKWNPASFGRPLELGSEIISIEIERTGPNPDVDVRFTIDSAIALQDGVALVPRLANTANSVREIVSWFSYEFETKSAMSLWNLDRLGRVRPAKVISRKKLVLTPFQVQGRDL
jgi:hypothetical protein